MAYLYNVYNTNLIDRQLQRAIDNIQKWRLKISRTKTIHFYKLRRPHNEPTLQIPNNAIAVVTTTKFLGILLNPHITWKHHINKLRADCFRCLNLLKALSNRKWGAARHILLKVYKALIKKNTMDVSSTLQLKIHS